MRDSFFKKGCCLSIIVLLIFISFMPSVVSITTQRTVREIRMESDEWYVDDSGNDSNSGKNWSDAWRHINYAVSQAKSGDTIYVGNGTYDEDVYTTKKLFLEGNTVDRGDEGNCSIIRGETVSFIIIGQEASGTSISNFYIKNSSVAGILVLHSQNVKISNNTIESNSIGIYVIRGSGHEFLIQKNNLYNHSNQCIYITYSKDLEIRLNHVKNSLWGIDLLNSESCIIRDNEIRNISEWDIFFINNDKENYIWYNNFIDNREDLPLRDFYRMRNSKNEWRENYWDDWLGLRGFPFNFLSYFIWGWKKYWLQRDTDPKNQPYEIPEPGPYN